MGRAVRMVAVTSLCGLVLPLAGHEASATSATAPAWAATATQATTAAQWPGLVVGAPVDPTMAMTVTVSVPLSDPAGARALVDAGRSVSAADFDATYGPTPATAAAVAGYLTGAGFTGVSVATDRLLVTATAPASDVDAAFDTTIDAVTFGGQQYMANTAPAMVPATLAGSITAVAGLSTLPLNHLAATSGAPASTCGIGANPNPAASPLCTIEPPTYQTTYDATGTPTGATTPVAIFAEGDLTQVATDFAQERSDLGLPPIAFTTIEPPADTAARDDTSGADEFDLDTQSSTGMAQTVSRLDVYDASSLDSGPLTDGFNAFATADVDKAGSASFGGCESLAFAAGETAMDDPIFLKAAAQGQTVFASSGDTGSACLGPANGVPAGVPGVEYPASSTYVIGVGGTSLLPNSTTFAYGSPAVAAELAWPGSGGGESTVEAAPSYQASDTAPYGDLPFKTVPDISNVADPNNGGAWVDVAGSYEGVGGTSLASPVSLGEWARIQSSCADRFGFAGPLLYSLAGTSAIHDIVAGNSGANQAAPGYDLATGLGSLDVAQVEAGLAGTCASLTSTTGSAGATGSGPGSVVPETPLTVGLPVAALLLGLGAWRLQRRRPAQG